MKNNAIYNAIQTKTYNTVQCISMRCNTMQYNAMSCNTIQSQIQYLWNHTKQQLIYIESKPLSKEKMYEQKVLSVCNKYDQLGYYLDVNALLELSSKQIILFYKYAEDIWNYRAQYLTISVKKKIVPDGIAFHIPIWMVRKYSPLKLKQLLII